MEHCTRRVSQADTLFHGGGLTSVSSTRVRPSPLGLGDKRWPMPSAGLYAASSPPSTLFTSTPVLRSSKKFEPISVAPALSCDGKERSASPAVGRSVSNYHQNSMASKPASRAEAARPGNAKSVKRRRQLARHRSVVGGIYEIPPPVVIFMDMKWVVATSCPWTQVLGRRIVEQRERAR